MKSLSLITGILLLLAIEILRVYFIMPFPGSQKKATIDIAYWLDRNIIWLRILLLVLIAYPVVSTLRQSKNWKRFLLAAALAFYAVVFYEFNFRFLAEKMFYQPKNKQLVSAAENKIGLDKLVIGVSINGQEKAYPIQLIGYHHQVRDTVGNTPVMITYCTVCRTGRVYSPFVNGKPETFRLVGMDHFNAMFEDHTTKSWWYQATGVAMTGPLKGKSLGELPSKQTTLGAWLAQYPNSLIMQPDTTFNKQYKELSQYDQGTLKSSLEKRDSLSWKNKSWVIGVKNGNYAVAYDWNELVKQKIIEDSLPGLPIVISLAKDTVNFNVWNRNVNGTTLQFSEHQLGETLCDLNTGSKWSNAGLCFEGPLKGSKLQPVQAYQEFWHSWKTFHPNTKSH
jgi:hypothetical protein